MKNIKLVSLSALVLSLAAIAWVNPVKITGGGMLAEADGTHLATLTLQCKECNNDGYSADGKFNYVDHQTGEHLKGALTAYVQCTTDSDPDGRAYANDCILFCEPSFLPGAHILFGQDEGGGTIAACIKDSGQGSAAPDEAVVVVRGNGAAQPFRRSHATVLGNFVVHP